MTKFNETADSRNTSTEVMEAIAFFARNEAEAEAVELWEGDPMKSIANLSDIWEHATNNGKIDDTESMWGDRALSEIMAGN
jgi:orotate phosphoribosyltransferase